MDYLIIVGLNVLISFLMIKIMAVKSYSYKAVKSKKGLEYNQMLEQYKNFCSHYNEECIENPSISEIKKHINSVKIG